MLRRILNLAPEGAVAAPPAAPAAPSTPPPAPKPVEGDPFAALESVMGGDDDSQAKPIATPAKPADKPKAPDKPAAPAEPQSPKSLDELIKDQKTFSKLPKEFRSFAERTANDNKSLTQKISDYEKKIVEFEARGKDTSKLTERLAQLEKDLSERDGTIRALRQESSPEFKAKYEQPFNEAAEFAKRTVTALEVKDVNAQGQESVRPATWEDFAALYQMPLNKASRAARQMFGDDAQTVINHINELQRLDFNRQKALEAERTQFKEKEAKDVADRKSLEEGRDRMWREANKAMAESNPDLFQPDTKDTKRAELLTKGLQIWDAVTNPKQSGMTEQAQAIGGAALRYRAASWPVLMHDNAKLKARVTELETKLKATEQGDPGNTDLGNPGGGSPSAPDDNEFDLGKAFTDAMEG